MCKVPVGGIYPWNQGRNSTSDFRDMGSSKALSRSVPQPYVPSDRRGRDLALPAERTTFVTASPVAGSVSIYL